MYKDLGLRDLLKIVRNAVKNNKDPKEAALEYDRNQNGGYNQWLKEAINVGITPDKFDIKLFYNDNPEEAWRIIQGKSSGDLLLQYKTPQQTQKENLILQLKKQNTLNNLMDYSLYEKLINNYMNKSVNTPMYAAGGPISINMYANGTSELATSDNPNVTEIGIAPEKWSTSIAPDFIEVTPEELQYFTRATMNVPDVVYSDESVPLEYKDVASKHTKWVSVPWDYLEEKYPNSRRSKDSKHTTYYTLEEVDENNPKKYYRLYRIRENSPEGRAYEYWKKQQAYEDRQSKEYKYNYGDGEWVDIGTSEVLPEVKVTYNPSTASYVEEPQEEVITSENTSKPIANSIPTSETSPYAQGNSEISYRNPFNAPDGELNTPNNNPYSTEGVSGGSSFGSGTEGNRMPDVFDLNVPTPLVPIEYEPLEFEPYEWQQEDLYYLSPPGYVPIPNWNVQLIVDTGEEGMDFADFMKSLAGYRDNSLRDELMSKLFEPKDYFADPYAGEHYTDTKSFRDAYDNNPYDRIQRESNGIPLYKNGGRINKFEVGGLEDIIEYPTTFMSEYVPDIYSPSDKLQLSNDALKYATRYTNSAGFKQRLLKAQGYLDNFINSEYDPYWGLSNKRTLTFNGLPSSLSTIREDDLLIDNANYNPSNHNINIGTYTSNNGYGVNYNNTAAHELGHAIANGFAVNLDDYNNKPATLISYPNIFPVFRRNKLYTDYLNQPNTDQDLLSTLPNIYNERYPNSKSLHDALPDESYADLLKLRNELDKYGIYDSTLENNVANQEVIDNYKKAVGNEKLNRLFENFTDLDIIEMLNEIAYNDTLNNNIINQYNIT